MAKIQTIKLQDAIDWRAVAADAFTLLGRDEPKKLSKADLNGIVERHTPKTTATVTMHTRLSYDEAAAYTRMLEAQRKEAEKAKNRKQEVPDYNWETVEFFVKDWTLTDADTGEPLPFTRQGFGCADVNHLGEVIGLCIGVAEGRSPNG